MKRLAILALSLTFALPAQAASPVGRGFAAGGITLGGEVVGLAAGAATGLAIGASSCSSSGFECWGPLIGFAIGGTSGTVLGGSGGAALGGHVVHARPGRTLGFAALGLGAGLSITLVGGLADSGGLAQVGLVAGALGMPVGAGIAAATDKRAKEHQKVQIALSPTLQGKRPGVALAGRF